eukprot:27043-Eustigmatos_ZCMA.PRE.1
MPSAIRCLHVMGRRWVRGVRAGRGPGQPVARAGVDLPARHDPRQDLSGLLDRSVSPHVAGM